MGKTKKEPQAFQALVTVQTRLTKQDYRRFLYFTLYFKKTFYLPAAALACLLVGVLWGNQKQGFQWGMFAAGCFGTMLILALVLVLRVELRLNLRIRQDQEGVFEKYDTIAFGEVLIDIQSQVMQASGQCGYDRFYQVLETNSQYLLYPNPRICSIIPKQTISPENQKTLTHLLAKNTGMRYQRRRWSV